MKNQKAPVIAKEKSFLINLRITESEMKEIRTLADKFAGGNLSLWLRHAGKTFRPRR